ncbi:hypothetical protein [Lysobacter enzymogenes]|uniref:hypothetical protein n=1 Tax=Lysobacter enzymogenes TaxID=69 RepID=UPI003CCE0C36
MRPKSVGTEVPPTTAGAHATARTPAAARASATARTSTAARGPATARTSAARAHATSRTSATKKARRCRAFSLLGRLALTCACPPADRSTAPARA